MIPLRSGILAETINNHWIRLSTTKIIYFSRFAFAMTFALIKISYTLCNKSAAETWIWVVSIAAIQDRDHGKTWMHHSLIHFFKKHKDLQNRYTRKQPTHFSIATLWSITKKKKFSFNPTNHDFRTLRKNDL